MMDKEVQKCLINYYSYLQIVDCKWNGIIASAKGIIKGLKNRCQQLRLVSRVDKVELYEVPSLREKLFSKIWRGIQEEMNSLSQVVMEFNNLRQELKNKLTRLEEVRNNVSLKDPEMQKLINGTPVTPKLQKLLIWAKDVCVYYENLYNSVIKLMNSVDYKDEKSIEKLEEIFQTPYVWRMRLNKIHTFTEIFSRNNISTNQI